MVEKEILIRYKMKNRDEMVRFLKSLWAEKPEPCPFCGGNLDYLHKKAKKSNNDWICRSCSARFDAAKILYELND